MAAVNVLKTKTDIAISKLKQDIVEEPNAFFPDFQEWFKHEKVLGDPETEIAFTGIDHRVSVIKFLEKADSLDLFIEDLVQIQESWDRHQRKLGTQERIGKFILIASSFPESFRKKISFLQTSQLQLLKVQPLLDSVGNESYFVEWESEEIVQVSRPEPQPIIENEISESPELETQGSEISQRLQVAAEKSNETLQSEETPADFFVRGRLSAEEELDFDKLNKKILTAAKSEKT